jgi:hypothetical protein
MADRLLATVPIFASGRAPKQDRGANMAEAVREVKFLPKLSVERSSRRGKVTFTPRPFTRNALAHAIISGLVLAEVTTEGEPPAVPRGIPDGTHYFRVEYVESGAESRWVGLFVNAAGALECFVPGVEVKLMATLGEHDRSEHDRPNISIHGMPRAVRLAAAAEADWVEYQGGWDPVGVGCVKTIFCAPAGGT